MDTKCGIRKFKFYFMLMNVLILCSIPVYQNNIDKWIFGIVKTYICTIYQETEPSDNINKTDYRGKVQIDIYKTIYEEKKTN